jgi:aldehyde:ferredoxin oxidoreductase
MQQENGGRALIINLPSKVTKKLLDPQLLRMFYGGLGLNSKILYDEVGLGVDPMGPDNIVVASPGALNGTNAPTTCRTEITTKSPLTGIFGTGNFGGYWGQSLRKAGYDSLIIKDRSPRPVYVLIDDSRVDIRDAEHLWGRDTWETSDMLKEELGSDFSVLAIGQAGENRVRFATVIVDREHAAGRSHAGAVLGSKKVKAVAVRGTGDIVAKWPKEFEDASKRVVERIKDFPGWKTTEKIGVIDPSWVSGYYLMVPNYMEISKKYVVDEGYGFFCPCPMGPYFGCNTIVDIKDGKYAGTKVGLGITICTANARSLGISLEAAFKLRELDNRFGIDYYTGGSQFFAMDLYQEGIITKADTGGLELVKGNEAAFIALVEKIAKREGIGDILAEGSERASKILGKGSDKFIKTMKGMEFPGDPRVNYSPNERLSVQINPRGGDDLKGTHGVIAFPGMPEWARMLNWSEEKYLDWVINRYDIFDEVKEKVFGSPPKLNELDTAMLVKWYNDLSCVFNSLGFCMFSDSFEAMGPTLYAELYSAYLGQSITSRDLMLTGERIFNLMRAYNAREGLRRKDDHWPERFYDNPLRQADREHTLSRVETDRLLDRYYGLRGWGSDGVPTNEKLRELELLQ